MYSIFSYLLICILTGSWVTEKSTENESTWNPCAAKKYNYDSVVCVCNATYCDDIGNIPEPPRGKFIHFVSSLSGDRLSYSMKDFMVPGPLLMIFLSPLIAMYVIRPFQQYQTIKGFGGAMSDAAGMNIATLTNETQEKLLSQYFGDGSIDYNFIRVPMGGTDFSTHFYTLDDTVNDTSLEHFKLAEEDYLYKIPFLKQAIKLSKQKINLLTASWTAPLWMKRPRTAALGKSMLNEQYYQLYADYHIKFLDEYKKHGLNFWGITPQNEPLDGYYYYLGFNSMGWTPAEQGEWIGNHLGPALRDNNYGHIELIILDDQRLFLPFWAITTLTDKAMKFVSGIGVHSYTDQMALAPASLLTDTHNRFPELFIINTEGCVMHFQGAEAVPLGLWDHAESYASSIMQDLNNWSTGWIDWNLALDLDGGPNWANNTVDSPIIVNSTADEFYKQPTFYALAHFSKFIPPGSKRIYLDSPDSKGIKSVAFLTPQYKVVIVLVNSSDENQYISITAGLLGDIQMWVPAHTIHTLIYKNTLV